MVSKRTEDKKRKRGGGGGATTPASAPAKIVSRAILAAAAATQAPPDSRPNIILHLRCSMSDLANQARATMIPDELKYNPYIPDVVAYNEDATNYFMYAAAAATETTDDAPSSTADTAATPAPLFGETCTRCAQIHTDEEKTAEINVKLRRLKVALYKDAMDEKKSACFWCSYDFPNSVCYIPRYEMDNTIHGYGAFCTPECAAGFLFGEDIDDSIKFERYHLLNRIYGKIYEYDRNIKPAPNPHYLLDKYYGNLSIDEFRLLSRKEHLFLTVDKPMTRVLPELHEEKDKNVSKTSTVGIYKVRRQSDRANKQTKNDILRESFGLV